MSCRVSISVSLGNTASPLVIEEDCVDSGLMWTELTLPEWQYRYSYAPPSDWVPGNVLLSAVRDSSTIAMTVMARGTTIVDLEAQKTLLENALSKWNGEFSATADDGTVQTLVAGPWQTDPTLPSWGALSPLTMSLMYAEATFSIPVNPVGAP